MGVPRANRVLERPVVDGQEPDPRFRADAPRATRVRGVRDRAIDERRAAETRPGLGPDQSARQAAHVAGDRHAATQPALCGIVDVPEYGVRNKRGEFEPLISDELFYRVRAILSGRAPSTAPRQRAHPDFPLRGFVRCESCGRGLTGSCSKGRSEYYAYYHCRPGGRAVNMTKARLEGLFADELALLQPTPGYMRLLKESVPQIWKARKAAVRDEIAIAGARPRPYKKSSTVWTKRLCSTAR